MRKEIDLLSKDLASGMSRRKALWNFVSGLGAVGALGALTSKSAKAKTNSIPLDCEILCSTQMTQFEKFCHEVPKVNTISEVICEALATSFYNACLQAAATCHQGHDGTVFCPAFIINNDDDGITLAVTEAFIGGEGGFVCFPVQGGVF